MIIVLSIVEICLVNPANWVNYILICGILFLVLFAHRANIKRLFTGKENKTELLAMLKKMSNKKQTQTTTPNESNQQQSQQTNENQKTQN